MDTQEKIVHIENALALIKAGWCQHASALQTPNGMNYCSLGALDTVMNTNSVALNWSSDEGQILWGKYKEVSYELARDMNRDMNEDSDNLRTMPGVYVVRFNDQRDMTQERVIAQFEKTLIRLRSMIWKFFSEKILRTRILEPVVLSENFLKNSESRISF